jgi:hypothetical protein
MGCSLAAGAAYAVRDDQAARNRTPAASYRRGIGESAADALPEQLTMRPVGPAAVNRMRIHLRDPLRYRSEHNQTDVARRLQARRQDNAVFAGRSVVRRGSDHLPQDCGAPGQRGSCVLPRLHPLARNRDSALPGRSRIRRQRQRRGSQTLSQVRDRCREGGRVILGGRSSNAVVRRSRVAGCRGRR